MNRNWIGMLVAFSATLMAGCEDAGAPAAPANANDPAAVSTAAAAPADEARAADKARFEAAYARAVATASASRGAGKPAMWT